MDIKQNGIKAERTTAVAVAQPHSKTKLSK